MYLKQRIQQSLDKAVSQYLHDQQQSALHQTIQLEKPKDKSHGDFASNVAMLLCKSLGKPPREVAQGIVAHLQGDTLYKSLDIAGPGFINMTVSDGALQEDLEERFISPIHGILPLEDTQTVVIDYSSPNLAKEMHVGHLRSTIIGDAIARLLEARGYQVIRQNHVGDWGTQFGMLLAHWSDLSQSHDAQYALSDLEEFYKAAKLRFDNEPDFAERARLMVVKLQSGDKACLALWERFITLSLDHSQEIYERLGVKLTLQDVYAESAYNPDLAPMVESLKKAGKAQEHEGALCIFMDEFVGKDGQALPLIIQKNDGGFLYASTDLAALRYRTQRLHGNKLLYVVDARQALHFQQIFAAGRKIGFLPEDVEATHISFGMVLDKSGKPFKSRDGGVTKLRDLLDEAISRAKNLIAEKNPEMDAAELATIANAVGIASVKYADLSKNRTTDYVFDWDSMLSFEGNTAPYLLYAYTRVLRILERSGQRYEDFCSVSFPVGDAPVDALSKQLTLYPEVFLSACDKYAPHFICAYLYDLAQSFSGFYEAVNILKEPDVTRRQGLLKLVSTVGNTLRHGFDMLGLPWLEKM